MSGPNSNGSPSSISDSLNAMSNSISTSATLLDSHHRFRPDKFNMRPRVQQFPWMRNGRSKSPGNWVRHLTSEDDVEEEEEEEGNVMKAESVESEARANKNGSNGNNNSRPEYQPSRLVGEIQLSSRVASMTIADVSPRFALKVSPLDCPLNTKFGCKRYPSIEKKFRGVRYTLIVDPSRFDAHPLIVSEKKNLACLKPS